MRNEYGVPLIRCCLFIFILLFCLSSVSIEPSFSGEHGMAVVVSKRIKPYMQVLEGMEQGLGRNVSKNMEVFFLSQSENNEKAIKIKLLEKGYDLFVAIGPEAGDLIWSMDALDKQGKIFSAILDPQKRLTGNPHGCGVSLRIPVEIQTREIAASFPEIKTIGLLFDTDYNQLFFEKALFAAEDQGLKIIPLPVDSKKGIPEILRANWTRVDCIWMIPDRTIISEKIVQYVIKQALYQKKGVIGYNPFFIRSGAFFAFEFDYKEIGIQTADMVNTYFEQGACTGVPPIFHKRFNLKMARTLGIRVEE